MDDFVDWACKACGKTARARAGTPILCTCGSVTWSATLEHDEDDKGRPPN